MIIQQFFKSLSYLFHPLLMPLLGVYMLFSNATTPVSYLTLDSLYYFPVEVKSYTYILITVLTLVAPLISVFILYKNKMISSFQISSREERFYPLVLILFYYGLAFFYVRFQFPTDYQHPALLGFFFGNIVAVSIALGLNFFMKVSLHAIGVFGIVGMLIGYSQTQLPALGQDGYTNLYLIIYLISIASLIASARLYLKAHSLSQVLTGMIIGFSVVFVTVKYGLYI
jgi:membrane-associated phospholipid phosphatase